MNRPLTPPQDTGESETEDTNTEEAPRGDSTLDALGGLFHRSRRYRHTDEYLEFLDFVGHFSQYSPYNAALLHVQNPGVRFTATRRQWEKRFDRRVPPDARPYVILQPFGPVLFVYDLPDTEPCSENSPEVPERIKRPFAVEGCLCEDRWERTKAHCETEGRIALRFNPCFHRRYAGRIERNARRASEEGPADTLYLITLNESLTREEKYGALAHELGHLFCGHLGADEDAWWEDHSAKQGVRGTGDVQREIEAESVAYLTCRRAGLHSVSERYLDGHIGGRRRAETSVLPPLRVGTVLEAVRYIEAMGTVGFRSKRGDESGSRRSEQAH